MTKSVQANSLSLGDYINQYYGGNHAAFARAQGTNPTQVSDWKRKGYIVVGHQLYSCRRKLIVS